MATKTAVKKSQKQAKYKTPKLLTAVLALGIAAALTYYLIQKPNNTNNNTTTTPTTQPAQNIPDQTTTKEPLPSTDEYLEIKEWSVRFKLPPELRGDVYYVIDNKGYVTFASREYDSLSDLCKVQQGGILKILRINKYEKNVDPAGLFKAPDDHSYDPEKDSFKIIDDYAYFAVPRSYGCLDVDQRAEFNKEDLIYMTISSGLESN